jgi:hypothetical protein
MFTILWIACYCFEILRIRKSRSMNYRSVVWWSAPGESGFLCIRLSCLSSKPWVGGVLKKSGGNSEWGPSQLLWPLRNHFDGIAATDFQVLTRLPQPKIECSHSLSNIGRGFTPNLTDLLSLGYARDVLVRWFYPLLELYFTRKIIR